MRVGGSNRRQATSRSKSICKARGSPSESICSLKRGPKMKRAPIAFWWALKSARICGCLCPRARSRRSPGRMILLNISASNETIGKGRYRTDLVVSQSGRTIAAYAMAGAGPSESTTDVVFGGHCLIAENGRLLAESSRVGDGKPIRRGSRQDHPGCRRCQAACRSPSHDQLRQPVATRKAFSAYDVLAGRDHGRAEARGPGHSLRAIRRPRASPALRRGFRHPVRGPGQAHRTGLARQGALYRHLGWARFNARRSGRGHDLRHARPRPATGSWRNDARLRHDLPHPCQCPRPDAAPGHFLETIDIKAALALLARFSGRWGIAHSASTAVTSTSSRFEPPWSWRPERKPATTRHFWKTSSPGCERSCS